MTLDRLFVETSALGFQAIVTVVLAFACYGLWLRQGGTHFLTWAAAWGVYVLRLAFIACFLLFRDFAWLFLHQVATSVTALLLLLAALQFSRGTRWPCVAWCGLAVSVAGLVATIYAHARLRRRRRITARCCCRR